MLLFGDFLRVARLGFGSGKFCRKVIRHPALAYTPTSTAT